MESVPTDPMPAMDSPGTSGVDGNLQDVDLEEMTAECMELADQITSKSELTVVEVTHSPAHPPTRRTSCAVGVLQYRDVRVFFSLCVCVCVGP